jgi:inositol oxygenase
MNKNSLINHLLFILLITSINVFASSSEHGKDNDDFRDYENAPATVREFYRQNHTHQTLNFVLAQKKKYYPLNKMRMTIWEAMEKLDAIVDESDPDLDNAQTVHAFQTAERLRKDGHPRWLILTGFIHDLGKVLILFDEPQWAVVGDTFPVGCAYSEKVIFADYFAHNPDTINYKLQTKYGIYKPNCGLDNVHMSWGHDEYLYQVVKRYLPDEALYIIRYHSFYAAHKDSAYEYLMDDYDKSMMKWLELFRNYDLYSKSPESVNISELLSYYQELVAEFFPEDLRW